MSFIKTHAMWAAVAWVLLVTPGQAQVRSIDVRATSEDAQYYLVFTARGGFPGHAYVVWGRSDPAVSASFAAAFGMYPASDRGTAKAAFGPVPGGVVSEGLRSPPGGELVRLIVRVDSRQYQVAEGVLRSWYDRPYQLIEQDCVTFTAEVAQAVGLRVPRRAVGTNLPVVFVRDLLALN